MIAIKHISKKVIPFRSYYLSLFFSNVHNFPSIKTSSKQLLSSNFLTTLPIRRNKYKNTFKKEDSDDESGLEEEDNNVDSTSKYITGRMLSLRVDTVLKTGLGIPRNKVETLFYENKIRVNGVKVNKKSTKLNVGDEVDVIKDTVDDSLVNISRVIISSVRRNETQDNLIVKMERYKHLTIENSD